MKNKPVPSDKPECEIELARALFEALKQGAAKPSRIYAELGGVSGQPIVQGASPYDDVLIDGTFDLREVARRILCDISRGL